MDEDGCCIECGTDCSIDGLVAYLKDLESERDGLKAEVEKLDCDAEALEYETLASQAYAARLREALPKVATAMKVLRTMCDVAGLKAGTQAAEDILEEVEAALAAKDQELKATLERVGNWRVLGEPIESALSKNAAPVNLAFTLQYLEDHSMPVTLSADLVNELYIAFAKKGAADE
jgi:maltooligosyltrehalose synthase